MLSSSEAPILNVRDLTVSIFGDEGVAHVLDGVDLRIPAGRIVGVVGESGSGKTTLVKSILGILPPTAKVLNGSIEVDKKNLLGLSQRELTDNIRGKVVGFIPQDPYLALNPVFKIGKQLTEAMRWRTPGGAGSQNPSRQESRSNDRQRLIELLRLVQIPDPELILERYPHEFSGGQRQRLLIAAALACSPALVVADEPTTALDVTTQFQILKLLKRLVSELNLSMLFVTHDFGVVAQLCHYVCVLYAGQTVEFGPTDEIINRPRHPYTRMLINCHPERDSELKGIPGTVSSPVSPPPGCRFSPRCPQAASVCDTERPQPLVDTNGMVACTLYNGKRGTPAHG
jgi:peptide/nickel transport system ATP-binding protein